MSEGAHITWDMSQAEMFRRLPGEAPGILERVLNSVLPTLRTKVEGATPEGIKYQPYKQATKSKHTGKRHKGRWVESGALKKSWLSEIGPNFIRVWTMGKYAEVLEEGKYPGIGKFRQGLMAGGMGQVSPRTAYGPNGGIYSSRAIGGILAPILQDQTLIDDITSGIKAQFARYLG